MPTASFCGAVLIAAALASSPAGVQNAGQSSQTPKPSANPSGPSAAPQATTGQNAAKPAAPKPAPPATPPPPSTPIGAGWTFSGSWRVRLEDWNWFPVTGNTTADGSYTFVGSLLRFGVNRVTKNEDITVEFAQPTLAGLPTQATAPAPQGALGLGSNYYDTNRGQVASLFAKQAFVRFKWAKGSQSVRLGRFEFSEGQENNATDPTINWLKQNRIGQRLIGPFAFTHVGRSFDGVQYTSNVKTRNVTFMAGLPTRGVFDLNGWDTLTRVQLAYLATTNSYPGKHPGEGRLFGIYYRDDRPALKVDNRPLATRQVDQQAISIGTLGGHYVRNFDAGVGRVDTMFWAAGQFGEWGNAGHGAYALAAEFGFQPRNVSWKPWVRFGYFVGSGDGNPTNDQHGTFFPILPTPRIYARDPFFTLANIEDLFAQIIVRPNPKLSIRADIHALRLADASDLWYVGGGAFNNATFGYPGRPSGGQSRLATLTDLSVDYTVNRNLALTLYLGYARGGTVIGNIYGGRDSVFGYLEAMVRF